MPVVDVSVIKAFNVHGVPIKKSFCVYVRLQGQAMRTKTVSGKYDEVTFSERFRFQYRPERKTREKNQLFVELWTRSMLSQSCVSVAWVDMDAQNFVQGVPVTFNMHGGFEGKHASVTVVVVPVDFGTAQQRVVLAPPPQQGMGYPYFDPSQPAVGVPLQETSPYPTAQYMPADPHKPYAKLDPITGQSITTGGCEAAPLPPQAALADPTLPPPLYGGAQYGQDCQQQQQQQQWDAGAPPFYQPPKTL